MPESVTEPALWTAVLAIAGIGLLWQLYRGLQPRRRPSGVLPHAAFWVSVTGWTLFGLLAHGEEFALQPPIVWRWLVPGAGLLASAALRWVGAVLPQLLAEAGALLEPETTAGETPGENGRPLEGELDPEDRRLLARMRSLLGRRAAELMVPLSRLATVPADASAEEILAALQRARGRRLVVLEAGGAHSPGAIDGLEIAVGLAEGGETRVARDLCRPVPTVVSWRPMREALEVLRSGGAGMALVVDGRERVVGCLTWPSLFRALLDRQDARARP